MKDKKKLFGKRLMTSFLQSVGKKITKKAIEWLANLGMGLAVNFTMSNAINSFFGVNVWQFCYLGGIMSFIFDGFDGMRDNRITFAY